MLLSALRRTGQRAVIATGWGGLSRADLPKEVFAVDAIPHDWLFPRMAGVVHHGGQGTTAASLRAGVPTAIIPFMGDQPFWGSRVAALGVGPPPVPCQHLTEHQLAEQIKIITSNDGIRTRALSLGAKIRQENGVAAAVEAFGPAHARLKSLIR
jgi:UDP:flavonoid glycosyltransferase YjiC (YdhE family)